MRFARGRPASRRIPTHRRDCLPRAAFIRRWAVAPMTAESDPPHGGVENQPEQIAEQDAPAPKKWNGFDAPYWTLPQTILWSVTGSSTAVNDASDYGESYSRAAAAAVMKKWIEEWELSREEVQYAADELWRACLHGKVTAYGDNDRPIDV